MLNLICELILKGNQKLCIYLHLANSKKFIYFPLSIFYFFITMICISLPFTYFYIVTLTLMIKFPVNMTIQNHLLYTSLILSSTCNLFIIRQQRLNIVGYAILIQKILFIINSFLSELIATTKNMFFNSYFIGSIFTVSITSFMFTMAQYQQHKSNLNIEELFLIIFLLFFLLVMFSMSEIFSNKKHKIRSLIFWTILFIAISIVTFAQIINDYSIGYTSGMLGSIGAVLALVFSYGTILDKIKPIIHFEMTRYSKIIDEEINKFADMEKNQIKEANEKFKALTIGKKIQLFLITGLFTCFSFADIFNIYNFNHILVYPITFVLSKAEYALNKIDHWEPRFYGVLFLSIIFIASMYRMILNLKQLKNVKRKNIKICKSQDTYWKNV